MRTTRRKQKTGSSTAPDRPANLDPGAKAAGRASVWPRPTKVPRSVSNSGSAAGWPHPPRRHGSSRIGLSPGARGRRSDADQRLPRLGRYSASRNSFTERRVQQVGIVEFASPARHSWSVQRRAARRGVVIGHRHPADFGRMLGRDGDFQVRLEFLVPGSAEVSLVDGENGLKHIRPGRQTGWCPADQ